MKNNKANESQAAQSAWVESFLRDASGAAVPTSERMTYAKDFFAQPGDTPQIVANKEALRQQKMDNARIASGMNTGHGSGIASKAPQPQNSGFAMVRSPDGGIHKVPKSALDQALAAGGSLVDSGSVAGGR